MYHHNIRRASGTMRKRAVLRPRATLLAGLLALAVAGVIVVVLALNDGSTSSRQRAGAPPQSTLRTDGGPEESGVAAAVGSPPGSGPDESAVASSIARGSTQPSSTPGARTISLSVIRH